MNLVLGMYQQGFKEGCITHTNVALREMNRYCKCRGRTFRYLSTVNCGFPLPDNIFYPDYSNVYVYVLCHTVNKRGDEELELNGKEQKIYDDVLLRELKRFKCKHLTLVLETCHANGIVGPEDEQIPQHWNVVTTCARDEKSLYDAKDKMGYYNDDEDVEKIQNTDFNYGILRIEGAEHTAYNIQVTYKVSVRN